MASYLDYSVELKGACRNMHMQNHVQSNVWVVP